MTLECEKLRRDLRQRAVELQGVKQSLGILEARLRYISVQHVAWLSDSAVMVPRGSWLPEIVKETPWPS